MSAPSVLRIGLLGCGTVGTAVAKYLLEDADRLSAVAGVKLELARVAVLNYGKPRSVELPDGVLTTDTYSVVTDPDIDIIVEAIGRVDVPRRYLLTALVCRKSVVTANKELIAASGWELSRAAAATEQDLRFEAAVAGAAPVVAALRGPLSGEHIQRIIGVLNGTSNFVLTAMEDSDCSVDEALAEARRSGFAESNPSADIDGHDSASKLAILLGMAGGGWVPGRRIRRFGIRTLTASDLQDARQRGYRVRLVAEATLGRQRAAASVKPALLLEDDPLARLSGVESGVHLFGERSGRVTLLGVGAGGDPSASAVIGDVIAAAQARLSGSCASLPSRFLDEWVAGGAPARELLDEPPTSLEVLDPSPFRSADSLDDLEKRIVDSVLDNDTQQTWAGIG